MTEVYDLVAKIVLDTKEYLEGIKKAKNSADDFADTMDDTVVAAENAEYSVKDLADQLDETADAFRNEEEAAKRSSKSIEDHTDASDDSAKSIGDYVDKIKTISGTLKSAIAASAAIETIIKIGEKISEAVDTTAALGDKIDKASQRFGLTPEEYQLWEFIFQHEGTSIDESAGAFKKLAETAASNKDALAQIGITAEQISSFTKGELFGEVVTKLQEIKDPAEKSAAAFKVFGENYSNLMPLLNDDAAGIANLTAQFKDLNIGMSDLLVSMSAANMDAKYNAEMSSTALNTAVAARFMQLKTEMYALKTEINSALAKFITPDYMMPHTLEEVDSQINKLKDEIDSLNQQIEEYGYSYYGIGERRDVLQEDLENWESAREAIVNAAARSERDTEENLNSQLQQILDERALAYVETYNAIRDGVSGYFSLFEETGGIAVRSVDDLSSALDSQMDYIRQYREAMTIISEYARENEIPMEALNAAIADAGKNGAEFAVAMAQAIRDRDGDKVAKIAEKYNELQLEQDALSAALTNATGAYDSMEDAAVGDIDKIKAALNDLVSSEYVVDIIMSSQLGRIRTGYTRTLPRKAGGIEYVPYNDYRVSLDEGEAVLTKNQNEAYRNGEASSDGKEAVIDIVIPLTLDGNEIGKAAYRYSYNMDRRAGR